MKINTRRFGRIIFIEQEESPVGVMLREQSTGVILERYYRSGNALNSEVLEDFNNMFLRDSKDLRKCLEVARRYEADLKVPIYVDIWSGSSTLESDEFFFRKNLKEYTDENLRKEFRALADKLRKEK